MHIIIPARYASTRLPGKPLAEIAGKPLVQWVHERAVASGADAVIIATDDERIRRACEGFGAKVCMTDSRHGSGTERIAEVIRTFRIPDEEIVVNVQGDEPLMPPALIRAVAERLQNDRKVNMSTAACPIVERREFENTNVVKVVRDARDHALYFSRAPVPWPRDQAGGVPATALRHIGIYGYRAGFVGRYLAMSPSPLEATEQLEQLRVLWHGEPIAVVTTDAASAPSLSVDTPADLEAVRALLTRSGR